MKKKKKDPNDLTLGEVETDVLVAGADYMFGEVQACDEGICPEHRAVFVALFNAARSELRRRGKKYKGKLPKPPKECTT